MLSYFQNASGAPHWPSIWTITAWAVAGILLMIKLGADRNERLAAAVRSTTAAEELTAANQRAADAQNTVAQLQNRLAPRLLDAVHRRQLTIEMAHTQGSAVDILVLGDETEKRNFAQQLFVSMDQARVDARIWLSSERILLPDIAPFRGIGLGVLHGTTEPAVLHTAGILLAALNGAGVPVNYQFTFQGGMPVTLPMVGPGPNDAAHVAPIRLVIGEKP